MHLVYANYTYLNKGIPQIGWRFMALDTSTHYPKFIPADQFQYEEIAFDQELNLKCIRENYLNPYGVMYQRLLFINFSIPQAIMFQNNIITYYETGALTSYAHYDNTTNIITSLNIGYQCALSTFDLNFNNTAYQNCFQKFLMPYIGTQQMLQEAPPTAILDTAHKVEATISIQSAVAIEATETQDITPVIEETNPVIESAPQQANISQAVPTIHLDNKEIISETTASNEAVMKLSTPELLVAELILNSDNLESPKSTLEVIEASKESNIATAQLTVDVIALTQEINAKPEELITPILQESIQYTNDTAIAEQIKLEMVSNTIPTITDPATKLCENITPAISITSEPPKSESNESFPKTAVGVTPKAPILRSKDKKSKDTVSIVPKTPTPKSKGSKTNAAGNNNRQSTANTEKDDSDAFLDQIIAKQKPSTLAVTTNKQINVNTCTLSAFQRCKSRTVTIFNQLQAHELSSTQALGIANLCVIYFVMVLHNPDFTKLTDPNGKNINEINKFFLDCFLVNGVLNASVFLYKSLKYKP